MKILQAVDHVNRGQAVRFAERIRAHFQDNVRDKRFGIWGLAFKPATNDMRDAPSIPIIESLLEAGATSLRTILQPWKKQREFSATVSHLPRTITTAWKELTLCYSSRSGRRFGTPISNE